MKIKQLEELTESQSQKKVWYVDGHEFTNAEQAAEYIMEECSMTYYDDFLDEHHGDHAGQIEICGHMYYASTAFQLTDPIAYDLGRSDWEVFEGENLAEELEEMIFGESGEWFDIPVICEKEEK